MIKITEDVSQWNTISKLIEWMNANKNPSTFVPLVVDIGANEGKRLSNSWTFITENNWRGILVEPVRETLVRAIENHADLPLRDERVAFVNRAISDTSGLKTLYIGGEDLMLSSFIGALGSRRDVDCITPKELFDMYNVTDVGVLSVDTEGHDLPILRSMMKDTKVRPQIIITETWPHLYYDNIQKHSLMLNEGYTKILHCGENEIFYRSR